MLELHTLRQALFQKEVMDISLKDLLKNGPTVINVGMEGFYKDLLNQKVNVIQVEWKPPLTENKLLEKLKKIGGKSDE